jgi:hypothetical protein
MDLTNTPSIESVLSEIVWSRRDQLIDLAGKSFRPISRTVQTLTPQATENWVDGFVALLIEALQSNDTSFRNFYLERLVSDMAIVGVHPQLLLQLSVAWSILVTTEITQATPEPYRSDAVRWFSTFFAGYVGAMSNIMQGQPGYSSSQELVVCAVAK